MKLDDELAIKMSEIINNAIDDEMVESLVGPDLIRQGWTQVHRNPIWFEPDPYLWHKWFNTNIDGRYRTFDNAIYFQDENDAVLYKLRWQY